MSSFGNDFPVKIEIFFLVFCSDSEYILILCTLFLVKDIK